MKYTHGRYAVYRNAVRRSSGHVWQGRFYSCPLDEPHLWEALRYVDLDPVRAAMTAEADNWAWSSARLHYGTQATDTLVDLEAWQRKWTCTTWRAFLVAGGAESTLTAIRRSTHTGRPLGEAGFIDDLEKSMQRRLAPRKGGRPPKSTPGTRQQPLNLPS